MRDILMAAAEKLTEKGYGFIKTMPWSGIIDENTEELCFYKINGSVINAVIIINGVEVSDAALRYNEITERIGGEFDRYKILSLGIVLGGAALEDFIGLGEFDPMARVMKVRWAVDAQNGGIIFEKGAPDRLDGIEKIFGGREEQTGRMIYELINNEAEKRKKLIKTNRTIFTYGIFAMNLFVFLLLTLEGGSENTEVLLLHGALYEPYVADGELYRLVTCMFLHIGIFHLTSNMISLYIFGTRCERYFGEIGFLVTYFLSGIGGAVMSVLFSAGAVSAGASGAIMGLMAAALVYTKINPIEMDGLDVYTLLVFSIINICLGFVYDGIDNWGHIGGFLTGLICGAVIGMIDKRKG